MFNKIRSGIILCLLVIFSLNLTGCETLRKKFIRQKKKDKTQSNEFIPVLEPIEYVDPAVSPESRYSYHLSLWKVFYQDLIEVLDEDTNNDKRNIYILDQIIAQMQEMSRYLKEPKKAEFMSATDEFISIRKEFDKPEGFRNKVNIKNRLDRVMEKVRFQFKPEQLQDYFEMPAQ